MPGSRSKPTPAAKAAAQKRMEDIKDFPDRVVRGAKVVAGGFNKAFNIGRENYIKAGTYGPRGMIKMTEEEAAKAWDNGRTKKGAMDMRKVNAAAKRTF